MFESYSPVTEVKVEDYVFPPTVQPPGSDKTFFLGGAGVRGREIEGKFIKFTAIGLYLEDSAIEALSPKCKGRSVDDLVDSHEFFRHIVTGPFEKFLRVTMILPLTGQQYSEKVIENCVKAWKFYGVYTDNEEKAIEKFAETFKDQKFSPGNSILLTQSPLGSLTIAFSEHNSMPENGVAVIENKNMAEAVTESVIGKDGVSPETKRSLASRVSELFNKNNGNDEIKVDGNSNATNQTFNVLENGLAV